MNDESFIKEGLSLHGIPAYEADIPYIELLLHTVSQEQMSLQAFPDLNREFPVMIFNKEVI